MSLKFFDQQREERKARYFYQIRPEILERITLEPKISLDEYKKTRMNSYERDLILTHVTDEALLWILKNCMSQTRDYDELIQFKIPTTYNQAINGRLLHELIRRFERKISPSL